MLDVNKLELDRLFFDTGLLVEMLLFMVNKRTFVYFGQGGQLQV